MSEFNTDSEVITLTTDFGTSDWFVGVMKGVMTSINPNAQFIDITHHITHGNIREAAFILKQALPWFPKKTIHLAVIDPGVGTSRNGLIIETESHYLVGPDNGIFSWALLEEDIKRIIRLDASRFNQSISRTFHGRDLFAPVAARLSLREDPIHFGASIDSMIQIDWPEPINTQTGMKGQILHVDRFGNLITNVPNNGISAIDQNKPFEVCYQGKTISVEIHPTYQLASSTQPSLIAASTGYLEFALKNGSASQYLGWSPGHTFELIFKP